MKGQGQFGVQPPLSPPDLSNEKPNDVNQGQTNQGNTQHGDLSPEFQDVLNQHSGQNQPTPKPVIVPVGGNQPNQPAVGQSGGNNGQTPIDTNAPGGEFGLDVRKKIHSYSNFAHFYFLIVF